jgi:hypothetical protein
MALSLKLDAKSLKLFLLFRFFDDFHQAPALGLAQRATFHDPYDITDGTLILFIMSMEAGSLFYELTIDRVFHFSFYSNCDGLFRLVTLHHPDPRFAQISFNHCFSF